MAASRSRGTDIARAALRVGALLALCVVGGLKGWWQLWLFSGAWVTTLVLNLAVVRIYNPELLWERLKPDRAEEGFDKMFLAGASVLLLGVFLVAALDVLQWHGGNMPAFLSYSGLGLFLLANVPVAWCMAVNRHLERMVRHQIERDHQVITNGPYRFVRHPMYLGLLLMLVALPLLLGSWLSALPSLFLVVLLVVRTHFEDRMLQEKLPGYSEYARRTRYRLAPFLW